LETSIKKYLSIVQNRVHENASGAQQLTPDMVFKPTNIAPYTVKNIAKYLLTILQHSVEKSHLLVDAKTVTMEDVIKKMSADDCQEWVNNAYTYHFNDKGIEFGNFQVKLLKKYNFIK
jgi:hypothetical protein